MAVNEEHEQRMRELQRSYVDFLDDSDRDGTYDNLVREMIKNQGSRLVVSINDLRNSNPERARLLVNKSFVEVSAFQRGIKEFVASIDATFAKETGDFFVGFEGSFGAKHVTPRTLNSRNLGNLVCLEGIITKCSLVRPKVVKSVHYCPATTKTMERTYTDLTSFDAYPSTAAYPTQDEEGNKLETEYGLSKYKDHQTITVQEMPEKAPAGQLPRSVDIIADNDLVDLAKPGDRVQIVGSYRAMPGKQNGYTNGTFKCVLIANNVSLLSKEVTPTITGEDVAKCKKFAKQKGDVFAMLSKSLAPSIHGHEYIKQALLCQLLGGVEKNLDNGSRLRGDINLLLIGDPSVAKSQLLRYVLHTAPRAITTTGRGSSGVGLTAAVTTDQETGDRRLEAGAMVLADRGIVCIDEFDKMTDMDRTAIHEVMEQGRVTISKAGIHARLNARCSVLAAANPVYGRYNPFKTPMENIGLQDSLLSRFDCLFIMLDTIDVDSDRKIADHVVRMHRYRNPREADGQVLVTAAEAEVLSTRDLAETSQEDEETQVYEKYDALLHGNSRKKTDKVVSVQFMKKYIHIAKCIRPVLSQAASELLADEYANLRASDFEAGVARTQPVTPRALETLIRLSTAHAKSRLSKVVEEEDADLAIQLVQFAYFKKVLDKKGRKKGAAGSDEEEEVEREDTPSKRRRAASAEEAAEATPPSKKRPRVEAAGSQEAAGPSTSAAPAVTEARLKQFMALLQRCISEKNMAESLELHVVRAFFNKTERTAPFSDAEIDACIDKMADDNKLMRSDDTIFVI